MEANAEKTKAPAVAAARALKEEAKPRQFSARRTVPQICRAAGISERMYYVAQEVLTNGLPDLLARVQRGDLSLHLAAQICRFPHDTQREILAEFETLTPRQRTHMLRLMLQPATT